MSYRRLLKVLPLTCLLVLGGCQIEEEPDQNSAPLTPNDPVTTPTPPVTSPPVTPSPVSTPPVAAPPQAPVSDQPVTVPGDIKIPTDPTGGIFPPSVHDIREVESIYQTAGYQQVDVLRVDVRTVIGEGGCQKGDYDGCTLLDVMQDVDREDDNKPRIDVHFKSDDFADDGLMNNAEFRQRGGGARLAPQKSFRIRLDDKDNLWRGERSLLLNKHPFEATRIRNKVAFDLMVGIPHLLSARTQFANLWIDDGQGPVDYGLFTHVEAPGGNFLEKRGRNRNDRLYKTNIFRFQKDDIFNLQLDAEGQPLDEDIFERSLEIESGDDHTPLANMLRDFHDPSRSFDSILDQYFNRNNVLSFMAVNFLLNQNDAIKQNFLLYNPVDTERFYFLPWDYDSALTTELEPAPGFNNADLQNRLFAGYARGSKSDFYSRYYRLPGMHDRMVAAANFIRQNYLTNQRITEATEIANQAVMPFMSRSPDFEFNSTYNEFAAAEIPNHVNDNLIALTTRFSYPMPPEMLPPVMNQGNWMFQWRAGIDTTGNELSYELQISSGLEFSPDQIVLRVENIGNSSINPSAPINDIADTFGIFEQAADLSALNAGEYFARVIARSSRDPGRFWQVNDNILVRDGTTWFGLLPFMIP